MKSEIAWLMEAFLEEDPKKLRIKIKDRMAEVTESLTSRPQDPPVSAAYLRSLPFAPESDPVVSRQSPSTQKIMMQNPDLIPKVAPPVTPAAAQALAARQALLQGAGKDKDGDRKSPRKM